MSVGRSTVQATLSSSHVAINCFSASAHNRTLSRSAEISESIFVTMLVDVKATTRLNDGLYNVGNALASNPAGAVQKSVVTGGSLKIAGSERSPFSHSTSAALLSGERDNAIGLS